jgi:hypothetical protein
MAVAKAAGRTAGSLLGRLLSNERVARSFSWLAGHPTATMAGIGGAAGFVTSGFSGWGAAAGALGGAWMGGGRGYKDPSKSWVVKDVRRFAGGTKTFTPRFVEGLAPGIGVYGSAGGMKVPNVFGEKKTVQVLSRGVTAMQKHARQWMPRAVGTMMLSGGIGIGAGLLSSSVKRANAGDSYGAGRAARYGALFSGMGNGTVRGY